MQLQEAKLTTQLQQTTNSCPPLHEVMHRAVSITLLACAHHGGNWFPKGQYQELQNVPCNSSHAACMQLLTCNKVHEPVVAAWLIAGFI
jgi:hypothetical protein